MSIELGDVRVVLTCGGWVSATVSEVQKVCCLLCEGLKILSKYLPIALVVFVIQYLPLVRVMMSKCSAKWENGASGLRTPLNA